MSVSTPSSIAGSQVHSCWLLVAILSDANLKFSFAASTTRSNTMYRLRDLKRRSASRRISITMSLHQLVSSGTDLPPCGVKTSIRLLSPPFVLSASTTFSTQTFAEAMGDGGALPASRQKSKNYPKLKSTFRRCATRSTIAKVSRHLTLVRPTVVVAANADDEIVEVKYFLCSTGCLFEHVISCPPTRLM